MEQHRHFLLRALAAARQRRGFCAPNPAVGAVIVKNNQIIATGHHFAAGYDHAEVAAFKALKESAIGATLYVTLEPCCHVGKTPPCTKEIIQQGIKRVVYSVVDPNPQVAGQGAAQLQATGVECLHLPLPEIEQFYQSYIYWQKHQRPWVTAKLAISLDGKIAGTNGEPAVITGIESQQFTHEWRNYSDALLTTVRTILHDDPQLNVRFHQETIAKPIYVLDRSLQFPLTARLLKTAKLLTLFYHQTDAAQLRQLEDNGIRCIKVSANVDNLSLTEILHHIGRDGMHDLWVEAGGRCFTAFHVQKLVQRSFIYLGVKWLGEEAQSAFVGDVNWLANAKTMQWRMMGDDAVCELVW